MCGLVGTLESCRISLLVESPYGKKTKLCKDNKSILHFAVYKWTGALRCIGANGLLVDEMGLGKAVQTIAFLRFLRGVERLLIKGAKAPSSMHDPSESTEDQRVMI